MRLRVLNAELGVAHEVVDGAARLGRLQTFIGRYTVSEGVHYTNLKDERKQSAQSLMEEQSMSKDVKMNILVFFYLGLIYIYELCLL